MTGIQTVDSFSPAFGINNNGWVTGAASSRAFIWDGTNMHDLGVLSGGIFSFGLAINDAGWVAGYSDLDGSVGNQHAFVWDGNSMRDLGTLGGPKSEAYDVNSKGHVVGWALDEDGYMLAFIWDGNGLAQLTDWWQGPGRAYAINDRDAVTGTLDNRAVIWGNTGFTDLGVGRGWDINNFGHVVGALKFGEEAEEHAFVWDGIALFDLNEQLVDGDGWRLVEARGINDKGKITGTGYFGGEQRAFLLTPVSDDKTPPVITRTVTGTVGLNGWYTGEVTVIWSVSDPESPITAKSGCDSTTLEDDTIGTALTCTATSSGGTATESVTIMIDMTPPEIECSVTPNLLSPPNHKLVDVAALVKVTDTLSGRDGFTLVSVTSNEADAGLDSTDIPNDIQGWELDSADIGGQLRAERFNAATGRVYTLTYRGMDAAGNTAECKSTVTVPRNSKK